MLIDILDAIIQGMDNMIDCGEIIVRSVRKMDLLWW